MRARRRLRPHRFHPRLFPFSTLFAKALPRNLEFFLFSTPIYATAQSHICSDFPVLLIGLALRLNAPFLIP